MYVIDHEIEKKMIVENLYVKQNGKSFKYLQTQSK